MLLSLAVFNMGIWETRSRERSANYAPIQRRRARNGMAGRLVMVGPDGSNIMKLSTCRVDHQCAGGTRLFRNSSIRRHVPTETFAGSSFKSKNRASEISKLGTNFPGSKSVTR